MVGDRLSQRHELTVTVPGHASVVMAVRIYPTIVDGRITRIDEYGAKAQSDLLVEQIPRSVWRRARQGGTGPRGHRDSGACAGPTPVRYPVARRWGSPQPPIRLMAPTRKSATRVV